MPFDPAKPAASSPNSSAEMRAQLTGLKDLIDAVPTITSAVVGAVDTLPPGAAATVSASITGTVLHLNDLDLPAAELLVALTVLVAGIVIVLRQLPPTGLLWLALPLAGVFHGYAYGESIIGAEPTALGGYLAGFSLIQFALIAGIGAALARFNPASLQRAGLAAGLIVALVGAWFSLSHLGLTAA